MTVLRLTCHENLAGHGVVEVVVADGDRTPMLRLEFEDWRALYAAAETMHQVANDMRRREGAR